jgi:hypothetical protein
MQFRRTVLLEMFASAEVVGSCFQSGALYQDKKGTDLRHNANGASRKLL